MPGVLDVFSDDVFGTLSLTTAIDKLPYMPNRIGSMGLFQETGVPHLSVMIEERDGKLSLLQTRTRGVRDQQAPNRKRKARTFAIPHIPYSDQVLADDIQGVRQFGSENQVESIAKTVNDKMAFMKQDHEATWEYHRLGAVKGTVLDADGSTIYDLFTEFGITQTTLSINFASDNVKLKGLSLLRSMETALGNTPYQYVHVLCGSTFFDNLITNSEVEAAYDRWQNGQFLRDDPRYTGFEYPKGIIWEEYRGGIGARDPFIAANKAHAIPIGVPNLFQRFNGPADYTETVNTIGRPLYAKQERMKFDRGIELETQSNPLHICNRPKCLIELTDTTP